ncbi:MAG TPA: subclass B3 metallo-beta-lactamase [Bryobacteraceae bacterium]|nr:subclass B3 metallo-beta-lactamase [Bryobacteraceae bacterium]
MRLALVFACALRLAEAQLGQVSLPENQPFPAHRVIGNVYYVGASDLASFLITTPAGHFLINSGFEETVPIIQAGVEKLGFRFQDIKILLTGQAHIDHVGGHALVRKLTGARVLVMTGDDSIVSTGGVGDFQYEKQAHWKACPVDHVLHDNESVSLGGVTLVARHTPGHTKGCTTFTLTADDRGKPYHVVIVGSANANDGYQLVNNAKYPAIADDFARTFRVLKSLECDVYLGSHGSYYGMKEKLARVNEGGPNPFIDPQGYRNFLKQREQTFLADLASQRAKAEVKPKIR